MLHIYKMYRATKYVDETNEKRINALNLREPDTITDKAMFIAKVKAITGFAEQRLFFRKIGGKKAAKIFVYTIRSDYLAESSTGLLTVTPEKGIHLIDGVPLLRVGLWNAWYKEYGGLLTFLTSGAVTAVILFLAKFVWHKI